MARDRTPEPPLWEQWAAERAAMPPDRRDGERLQKVLATSGWGSRRVAEDLISAGRVTVNGEVAILGRRVDPENDLIEVDGAPVGARADLVYFLLNKRAGVVTTARDTHGRPTVLDDLPREPRVYPVGRLDAETEGLLLVMNDGVLANRIAHPSSGVDKEYLATVEAAASGVPPRAIRTLREGVQLDDGITHPADVSQPHPGVLRITIHEGRNRQIRRMCEAVGHPVVRLVRTRIGPITDRKLKPGEWRELSSDEVRELALATAHAAGSVSGPAGGQPGPKGRPSNQQGR
jgi:23S rRNA pseudouridine2605 synthase